MASRDLDLATSNRHTIHPLEYLSRNRELRWRYRVPSPFPGMDPYLEHPSLWPDVHNKLISEIQSALNPQLPPKYVARMDARVYVSDEGDPGRQVIVPDLRIEKSPVSKDNEPTAIVALEVAESLEYPLLLEEEITEVFLAIKEREPESLVTIIEVLSYTNKVANSAGRKSFLDKRREVLATQVNWLEIDLLRRGERLPTAPPLVASDYRITVSRGDDRKKARYWPIRLNQRLPVVGVPLRKGEQDVLLDLGQILTIAYDRAAYDRSTNYGQPPIPALRPNDANWANTLLQEKGLRK